MNMKRIGMVCITAILAFVLCLSGCAKDNTANKIYESKEDFAGVDAGAVTGTTINGLVDNVIDGINWHYYDDWAGMLEALKKDGMTMMLVTHEMKFAKDVSTRIFYMDEGIIYDEGTPQEIFEHPTKDKTRTFVKRLKVLSLQIKSEDYDFIAMSEALQNFGEKHMLTRKRTENMRRIFEEILALNVIPNAKPAFPLDVVTEYEQETDRLEMRIAWHGAEYNPLTEGNEISLKLVGAAIKDGNFLYESGENRLTITL